MIRHGAREKLLYAVQPKMDGCRGQLWRRDGTVAQLFSRSGRDLGPWFPEIIRAAEALPRETLLDGEIVISDEGGLADFGALQHRLTLARKFIADAIQDRPPSFSCSMFSNWRGSRWLIGLWQTVAERWSAYLRPFTPACSCSHRRPTMRWRKAG